VKIDDYFANLERSLRANVRVSRLEEPHPEIVTYPHHKHIGETDRLVPADPPVLRQILEEIEDFLE